MPKFYLAERCRGVPVVCQTADQSLHDNDTENIINNKNNSDTAATTTTKKREKKGKKQARGEDQVAGGERRAPPRRLSDLLVTAPPRLTPSWSSPPSAFPTCEFMTPPRNKMARAFDSRAKFVRDFSINIFPAEGPPRLPRPGHGRAGRAPSWLAPWPWLPWRGESLRSDPSARPGPGVEPSTAPVPRYL